jgi:hypothetical protein
MYVIISDEAFCDGESESGKTNKQINKDEERVW